MGEKEWEDNEYRQLLGALLHRGTKERSVASKERESRLFLKMGEVATCLLMAIIHRDEKCDGEGEKD